MGSLKFLSPSLAPLLAILLSSSLAMPLAQAALTCEAVFAELSTKETNPFPQDIATLKKIAREQEEALKVSKFILSELTHDSTILKNRYAGKILELDVLCVGAGPQCAAASLVIGKTKLTSLVIEKTKYVAKTFAEKDFFINSVETETTSMHDFPGGFGSLAYLTSQTYAHSSQLATHIQSQQYVSGVPVLLETKVISSQKLVIDGKTYIELVTDQGITIRAKNVLLGTGLGEIGTKVKDLEYQKSFADFHASRLTDTAALQPIMSTDAFLVSLKNSRLQKLGVNMPRDIILIGNGDGSRIAIEGLSDSHVKLPEGFKIKWIGNNFQTAQEYTQSQGGWDRYLYKIVPQYEQNRISGLSGYVEKVEVLENGRYLVTVKDSKNNVISQTEGDMIIDSTGYTNQNAKLLAGAVKSPELVDITGPLKELDLMDTVIARQYQEIGGDKLPVYAVGSAAGSLAKETELVESENKNSVAIFNTVARTSQFVAQLLGVTAPESVRGARTSRPAPKSAAEIIKDLKSGRQK